MQHAHAFEVVQDGRIYIEKINGPFLYVDKGTPEEYAAGLALPSNAAGSNSMTAGPSFASRKAARTCSPDQRSRRKARQLRTSRTPQANQAIVAEVNRSAPVCRRIILNLPFFRHWIGYGGQRITCGI